MPKVMKPVNVPFMQDEEIPIKQQAEIKPAPTEEKPEKVVEPPKPPTPEEIEAESQEFMTAFGYTLPKKKEEPKTEAPKEEPPKEEAKTEATPPKAEEPPKPKKKKPTAVESQPAPAAVPQPNLEELAEATARRTVEAMKPTPTEHPGTFDLTPEDQETIEALKVLDKPGTRNAGLVKRTLDFWAKDEQYQQKWEDEHPGEAFNASDEQHAAWYSRNEPKVDAGELAAAKRSLAEKRDEERIAAEVDKRFKATVAPHLQRVEAERIERELAPVVAQVADKSVNQLIVEAVPEFKAIVEKDGQIVIDEETVKKMQETNPAAFELLDEEADGLRVVVGALERISRAPQHNGFNPNATVKLKDGSTIRPHQIISEASEELQQRILEQPQDKQVFEGKKFAPLIWLDQQREAIRRSVPKTATDQQINRMRAQMAQLDQQFWTITTDDLRDFITSRSAKRIAKTLGIAKKLAGNGAGDAPKNGANGKSTEKKEEAKPRAKPSAPSVASASDNVNTRRNAPAEQEKELAETVKMLF